ncbi:GNAT family N-acetyltransferase [Microbacterium sp.]|uniref:GNAT family N-acetyltransferase n=1 Tax=Microbacterium sp. TaxID=51671 RepID=UPI003C78E300
MEPVALRTARLELSVPVEADAAAIYEACQDPLIQRYTTVPSPYERGHAEEFIRRVATQWSEGVHLTWAVREGETLVGTIGVYRIDGKGAGELGYWVSPGSRRRGLLTEAARAVIDWGFSDTGLRLRRLEWRAVVGNVASARAAQALGFRYEGLLREGLAGHDHRDDGWIAGLLATDDRIPSPWPVLEA